MNLIGYILGPVYVIGGIGLLLHYWWVNRGKA